MRQGPGAGAGGREVPLSSPTNPAVLRACAKGGECRPRPSAGGGGASSSAPPLPAPSGRGRASLGSLGARALPAPLLPSARRARTGFRALPPYCCVSVGAGRAVRGHDIPCRPPGARRGGDRRLPPPERIPSAAAPGQAPWGLFRHGGGGPGRAGGPRAGGGWVGGRIRDSARRVARARAREGKGTGTQRREGAGFGGEGRRSPGALRPRALGTPLAPGRVGTGV